MSVKITAFKKLPPTQEYACSVLEVQKWAKGFADLRIDFGTHKSFQFNTRFSHRPKIEGIVAASVSIDNQLRPALFFYPIPAARFSEQVKNEFRERILNEIKKWLEDNLLKFETEFVGSALLLIEWKGAEFKAHQLRYL